MKVRLESTDLHFFKLTFNKQTDFEGTGFKNANSMFWQTTYTFPLAEGTRPTPCQEWPFYATRNPTSSQIIKEEAEIFIRTGNSLFWKEEGIESRSYKKPQASESWEWECFPQ